MIKTIEATDNEIIERFDDVINSIFQFLDESKIELWKQNRMDKYFQIEDIIERLQYAIDDMTIESDDD
jgi:hypothetical protein